MRIDLSASVGQTLDAGPAGKADSRAVSGAGSAEVETDSTQLSADHVKIQALSTAVLRLPEIRQGKVEALAEQVRQSNYQVSAQETAEALLTALTTNRAA
jgi:anti-sigma28 factor (negative regulator of flagellin synthesis)